MDGVCGLVWKIRCYKICGSGIVCKYMGILCILGICVCLYVPLWFCHQCSDELICAQTLQIFGSELLALADSREKSELIQTNPSHTARPQTQTDTSGTPGHSYEK